MKLIAFLPQFLRLKIIRMSIRLAPPPSGLIVKIAKDKAELESSYSLLHDCYVASRLMTPDPSGIRCSFFSFLPNTTSIVAMIDSEVVGTISLIKDSHVGLPSDKDFKWENNKLRKAGHKLVEVSSLAVAPKFRNSHMVSLYIMKYLQHYATHYMDCTTVTCVVHPRTQDFYKAYWGFESSNRVVKYQFVNNALGVQMYGRISDEDIKLMSVHFPKDPEKSPIEFLFRNDKFLIYPERSFKNCEDPIYTPALLKYFMSERTQAYKAMTRLQLLNILSAYSLFFDNLNEIDFFKNLNPHKLKRSHFRYAFKIQAVVSSEDKRIEKVDGDILDLTQEGAFIATNGILEIGKSYSIEFDFGGQSFVIPATVAWRNYRNRNHQDVGYGIKFAQPQLAIRRLIKHIHVAS